MPTKKDLETIQLEGSLICTLREYLLSAHYVPSAILGTGSKAVKETKFLPLGSLCFGEGKMDNKQTRT